MSSSRPRLPNGFVRLFRRSVARSYHSCRSKGTEAITSRTIASGFRSLLIAGAVIEHLLRTELTFAGAIGRRSRSGGFPTRIARFALRLIRVRTLDYHRHARDHQHDSICDLGNFLIHLAQEIAVNPPASVLRHNSASDLIGNDDYRSSTRPNRIANLLDTIFRATLPFFLRARDVVHINRKAIDEKHVSVWRLRTNRLIEIERRLDALPGNRPRAAVPDDLLPHPGIRAAPGPHKRYASQV